MRILLDTHVLLWALISPAKLKKKVRTIIEQPENQIIFSAASIWEIAIKNQLGKSDFTILPEDVLEAALETEFTELPISANAASFVYRLPFHHRDPFDRLLIAQAVSEPARFFTADRTLQPYSELVTLIA